MEPTRIWQTKYGDTVASTNPMRDAYSHAEYLIKGGQQCSIMERPDGSYTLIVSGSQTLTFMKED